MNGAAVQQTTVILYGRAECHLCDEARAVLRDIVAELGGLELREVDIEADERLHSAYLERIPVVEVGGEVISELVPDPERLRARLDTLRG